MSTALALFHQLCAVGTALAAVRDTHEDVKKARFLMDETRALAALHRWGNAPVQLDTTVCDLAVLAGALHLALRHPHFPATSRAIITQYLEQWADTIGRVSPPLRELLRRGGDQAHDVPGA